MPTQLGKLYSSNINCVPVTIHNQAQQRRHANQTIHRRQNNSRTTLLHAVSHSNFKQINLINSLDGSKQTMPYQGANNAHSSSFLSIDDAYLNPRFQKKKQQDLKILHNLTQLQSDTESLGGRSIKTYQGADQYYKYWKSKAHQYLEQNFKLREENKKLKVEIQHIQKTKINQLPKADRMDNDNQASKQKSFSHLENIFKKKLDQLENQLKQKNFRITNLEDKVLQMNRKILGEQQRTHLITRLGQQVDTLSNENVTLKKLIYQLQNKQKMLQELQIQSNQANKRYRSKQKPNLKARKSTQKDRKK